MVTLIDEAYKIAENNDAILRGKIKLSNGTNCLLFAYYCDSTLFYKKFFKISKDSFNVNKKSKNTIKEVKKLLKKNGYKNVWSKGVFSFYGDLRPLAVAANFGKCGEDGIIENEKYGTNFLISAIFYI